MNENSENSTFMDLLAEKNDSKNLMVMVLVPLLMTLFFIQGLRAYFPILYVQMFHVVFQDEGWMFSLLTLLTIVFFFVPLFALKLSKIMKTEHLIYLSVIVISVMTSIEKHGQFWSI